MPERGGDPAAVESYGPVAQALHWLVALLVAIVIGLAWAMPEAPRQTDSRSLLFLLHRSIGLTILVLMVFRILWRLSHPPPPLPADFPRIEAFAAHADHALLYLLFILMPVSGYLNAAFAGHPVSFFGVVEVPPLVGENPRLSQAAIAVHLAGQFAVYALVGVHIAAALVHRFVRRNAILARMLPVRRVSQAGR